MAEHIIAISAITFLIFMVQVKECGNYELLPRLLAFLFVYLFFFGLAHILLIIL
jgi:hypothetical protein